MDQRSLPELLRAAWKVIQTPTLNRSGATLFLAAIAALFLVVIVLLAAALLPSKRVVRKRVRYWVPDGVEPPQRVVMKTPVTPASKPKRVHRFPSLERALMSGWLPVAIVMAAVASGYAISSQDQVCALTCHGTEAAVASAVEIDHSRCVSCHDTPGLSGVAGNVTDRFRMAVRRVSSREIETDASVDERSCLSCHERLLRTAIMARRYGIRMSHKEPVAAGMLCESCHPRVGHARKESAVSMSRCIGCHDGTAASAECATCHMDRGISTHGHAEGSDNPYPKVAVDDSDCGGCHDLERSCDPCHGLRMPHSGRFLEGYHASQAAWSRKQLCWRCHQETDCSRCHLVPFDQSHAPGWRSAHTRSPKDSGCVCHARAKDRPLQPGEMCRYCH